MVTQWIGVGAALLAAVFWLISAFVKIPDMMQTKLSGKGSITDIMRKQSRWSAIAAVFAAISALAGAYVMRPH